MLRIGTALLLCLLAAGCDSLSKKPKFTISVHAEGNAEDNPRMIFGEMIGDPPTQVIFKKLPEFTQEDVAAFHAFPADDGTNGVALKLDFRGTNALEVATRMRSGEIMRSVVNGLGVDYVIIDQPISDGIFTIWRGVPDEVVQRMAKKWPPINRSRSSGHGVEMLPTTKKEKREAMRYAREDVKAEKKEAEKKERDAVADPQKPSGVAPPKPLRSDGLPQGATSDSIMKERGALLPREPTPAIPQR